MNRGIVGDKVQALDKSFEYDVFICHSSKDKPVISTLIEYFKKENVTYWVDSEQIDYGDQITRKIDEGLKKSKFILPCISQNLITSGWTRAEYGAILNAEFSGNKDRKVIPLLIEDCFVDDIPPLLRDKKWVSFLNKIEFDEFINFLKKNHLNETNINTEIPKTFTSLATGMEFVLIPAGEFLMGSCLEENDRENDETPRHKVTIKNAFYFGKYPVTQKQWEMVMRSNPSHFKGEDRPVESVSWRHVQVFINELNQIEGTKKYRLPSEAEWEYACRAGTESIYFFGDDESKLVDYAWYDDRMSYPVGLKKVNPWGLYDIYGNVWEWCQDTYHDSYFGAPNDGSAWEGGHYDYDRVRRGGGWFRMAKCCRSASRYLKYSIHSTASLGFRLVKDI